ncbi:hypothetical protein PTKIN_Ptkin09bG0191100 [Pterospermum kingtungense]
MVTISVVISIFMTCLMVAKKPEASVASSGSGSPVTSCSTVIYDMADCVSFLSNGSADEKPTPSCCSGFQRLLKTNALCICEALKSSSDQLGFNVNLTKAATLPSACHVSAPPITICHVSFSPAPSPEANPPSPKIPKAPAVPGSLHSPTPPLSGTDSLAISCFFVLITMLLVSFSYMLQCNFAYFLAWLVGCT